MLLFDMNWKFMICYSSPIFLISNFLTMKAAYIHDNGNVACYTMIDNLSGLNFNRLLIWLGFILYSLYTKRHSDLILYLQKVKDREQQSCLQTIFD